jgi:hypothetical protein
MTRQHWLIDRLFSMTPGVAHTVVNPGFFADAYLVTIGMAAHLGMFPWIFGNSRNAPPSNEDIARVAVAILMDPARHAGKSYRPTGPELLRAEDMAKAIGRAIGRSVAVMPTPTWMFMKGARMLGMPIEVMSQVRYYVDDHKRGAFELGAPTTDVLDVTGRPAEDFETIARRYAAHPRNSRTVGNWLREFTQFMISRSAPASISTATSANCAVHSRAIHSLRPSPKSGGASTLLATSPSPACCAVYNARSDSESRQPATIGRGER